MSKYKIIRETGAYGKDELYKADTIEELRAFIDAKSGRVATDGGDEGGGRSGG